MQHSDNGTAAGAAYVYRFNGVTWAEEAKLEDSQGAPFDNFGGSVAMSSDAAVIGAPGDDDNGGLSGSAFVYRFDGMTWSEEAKLLASDGTASHHFGGSVAIKGDVTLVGAIGDQDNGSNSGSAYVYRFECSAWIEEAKLVASDGAAYDVFGFSVGVSGDVALVGAERDDDNGADSGSAYIFDGVSGLDSGGKGTPVECECPWDLDADGSVGVVDLLALLGAWGTNPGGAPDFDKDRVVGVSDLLALLSNWGECP